MNNEELKKKLIKNIRQGFANADCRKPYTNVPYPYFDSQIFCIADALIAAGIGDISAMLEYSKSASKNADEERKNLIEIQNIQLNELNGMLKEAQHRAEVAERAVLILANDSLDYTYNAAIEQAEKELAEEKKDD